MKIVQMLLLVVLLLQVVWTRESTQVEISFLETLNQANMPLYQRIEKKSLIDYPFQLRSTSTTQHIQFPELDINFETSFSQDVQFIYNVNVRGNSGDTWIETRLIVDGKQIIEFGGMAAHLGFPGIFRFGEVFLEAGSHRATVYYRGNYLTSNNPPEYSMINYLKVKYYRPVAN